MAGFSAGLAEENGHEETKSKERGKREIMKTQTFCNFFLLLFSFTFAEIKILNVTNNETYIIGR